MKTFRNNNNRRFRFRNNDRNFKRNGDEKKFNLDFSSPSNFQRKAPGRNNHNAPKLIEKYNDLAREASSNGDKILSENYLQHADHFTRVLNEQENFRKAKFSENRPSNITPTSKESENIENDLSEKDETKEITENISSEKETKEIKEVVDIKKISKKQVEAS